MTIKLELTEEDVGALRGAIDFAIRQGGTKVAQQIMYLDDKISAAYKAAEQESEQ